MCLNSMNVKAYGNIHHKNSITEQKNVQNRENMRIVTITDKLLRKHNQ